MTTVYKDGPVRVTLTGLDEEWARRVLGRVTQDCVTLAETELEPVAVDARARYYGPEGVKRVTGKGGDIRVVTTIDVGRNVVRVSVGSTDDRTAGKSGKVVAVFQHRPGILSTVQRPATKADFASGKAKASPYVNGKMQKIPGHGVVTMRNPAASDGKYLLAELVRKPARVVVKKRIKPGIVALLKARIEGTS